MIKRIIFALALVGLVGMADAQQNSPVVSGDQPAAVQGSADNSGAQAPMSDDLRVVEEQQQLQYQQRMQVQRTARPCKTVADRFNHCHEVWPGTVQSPETPDPVPEQTKNSPTNRHVSGVSSALSRINPNDVNYGGLLSEWNLHIVDETILEVEFWSSILFGSALVIALAYISWLHRQRDDRYRITVDIIMQLLNSRDYALFHNLRVIKKHNDLVARLNEEFDNRDSSSAEQTATKPPVEEVPDTPLLEPNSTITHQQEEDLPPTESDQLSVDVLTGTLPVEVSRKYGVGEYVPGNFGNGASVSSVDEEAEANLALNHANATATQAVQQSNQSTGNAGQVDEVAALKKRLAEADRKAGASEAKLSATRKQNKELRERLNLEREVAASGEEVEVGAEE
jgi:hypothetical protein